jgi:hypothetical protein
MSVHPELQRAFMNIEHPGNDKLLRSGTYDMNEVAFLEKYENKNWQSIDRRELEYNRSSLFFLSDDGLAYVIPAYLNLLADQNYNDPYDIAEPLLTILSSGGRGRLKFNTRQAALINSLFLMPLEQIAEHEDDHESMGNIKLTRRFLFKNI